MKPDNLDEVIQKLQRRGLFSWSGIIVGGSIREGEPAIQQQQTSVIDDEGLKNLDVKMIGVASGCQHVIGSPERIGAVCSECGSFLCFHCSRITCSACGRVFCGNHRRQITDGRWFCDSCYEEWARGNWIAATVFIVIVAVLAVLIHLSLF